MGNAYFKDSILSTIGAYHYPFNPINAAHLHIALLTEDHRRNRLLSDYLREAVLPAFHSQPRDLKFDRSEELFDSQCHLTLNNLQRCIARDVFASAYPHFKYLV